MKKTTKKGFTLIELIVVIAILAILAIIAVPVVTGMVDKAHASANAANARTIELAVKAYMTEKDVDTLTSGNLTTALTEFGLSTPLSGSKCNFTVVTSTGAVNIVSVGSGGGTITLAP